MASNAQGEGSGSSRKRGRKNGAKPQEPKVKQRGMGVAQLEHLRIQNEMAAAAGSVVPYNNLQNIPVYLSSLGQMHESARVHQGPYNYLAAVMPSFSNAPMTAPLFLAGPRAVEENLSFKMLGDSSSPSLWHASDPAPSSTPDQLLCPRSTKMSMGSDGSDGCDLQLRLISANNQINEEEADDLEFRQPNYFTKLLLGKDEDAEKEAGENKKARTDSLGEGSAAAGSSTSQEPDLELRLFL